MSENVSWVAILGAVSGVFASLGWIIKWISNAFTRPRLVIVEGPYIRNWRFINTKQIWQFVNLEVVNKKGETAYRCTARAKVIEHPNNITHLNKEYALHWADVPYSTRSTGAEPVDIWTVPHRLDIVFKVPQIQVESYLAMPIALSAPGQVPQAKLPPGEYILEVKVSCENGKGDKKIIKVISPNIGQQLQAEEIKRIRWYRRILHLKE